VIFCLFGDSCLPIENFINKAKIASKSNQKTVTLSIEEAVQLSENISITLVRLAGMMDQSSQTAPTDEVITVAMDGGGLR
jgi:hypothetical protein